MKGCTVRSVPGALAAELAVGRTAGCQSGEAAVPQWATVTSEPSGTWPCAP